MTKLLPAVLLALPILSACAQTPDATQAAPEAAAPLDASQLAAALDDLLATHETAKRIHVTLVVHDLATGDTLYNRGGDKLLTPASNLKIYTAAAAIDLLGPDYRWTTKLIAHGQRDNGFERVTLVTSGDPMLSNDQLDELMMSAADAAPEIETWRRVDALEIYRNPSWDDVPRKGPGWMWDDDPDYYNMSIAWPMLDFNVIDFVADAQTDWRAGDAPAVGPGVSSIFYEGKLGPAGSENTFEVGREAFSDVYFTRGSMPRDAEPMTFRVAAWDPDQWMLDSLVYSAAGAASWFSKSLNEGNTRFVDRDEESASPLAEVSNGLPKAVQHFLRVSENAVGEMLLLHLAEKFDEDGEVSWPSGAKVISDWLINEAGVEEGSFRLVDGSGLSRYNLISANSSIQLLDHMDDHEHFEVFFDGLPVYQVALPEAEKWNGVPMAEFDHQRIFAKPGGMSGVNTISGYLDTLDGRRLAFSLLANGYIGSSAPVRDLRGAVWSTLVRYRAESTR